MDPGSGIDGQGFVGGSVAFSLGVVGSDAPCLGVVGSVGFTGETEGVSLPEPDSSTNVVSFICQLAGRIVTVAVNSELFDCEGICRRMSCSSSWREASNPSILAIQSHLLARPDSYRPYRKAPLFRTVRVATATR